MQSLVLTLAPILLDIARDLVVNIIADQIQTLILLFAVWYARRRARP